MSERRTKIVFDTPKIPQKGDVIILRVRGVPFEKWRVVDVCGKEVEAESTIRPELN